MYACTVCGTVRVDDTVCGVCDGERFAAVCEGGDGEYDCDDCDETFDTPQSKAAHVRTEH